MDIGAIQTYLKENHIDGWLLADFHGRNTIAVELLGLTGILTRRSFYFIPQEGTPRALVSAIEKDTFAGVEGEIVTYSSYRLLEATLSSWLSSGMRVAMEYSPSGRLPYIGLVDAGTVELVRSFGVEVVSSADLVAHFQARLTDAQMAQHRLAARDIMVIKDAAFAFIAQSLKEKRPLTEFEVVRFILEQFEAHDMTTAHPPICAVDAHAGNPHFEPSEDNTAVIQPGGLVLIDMWAKKNHPDGVYADITWVAYAGREEEIPEEYHRFFSIITEARDTAVSFVRARVGRGEPVYGFEIDDACREVVVKAGYGERFTHRTGHSIMQEVHGVGPNIDNLETQDRRQLQPGHLFSIEPGVYFDHVGFRTEIDVLITPQGVEVTTLPLQTSIVPLA